MKKKKTIILASIIVGVLVVTLGLTYASLSFNRTGGNSQLVLGDIWMHYSETNQLVLSDAMPSSTYDETKYFEFTIDGKNTYLNKDIWYEIVLNHGDNHETRTERIKDKLLKFTLVEIVNGEETVVVNAKSYDEINNTRIWVNTISKNTTEEVNKTYRLYMWISDSTLIGNIPNADYDIDTWNNQVYASIKVSVNGDFNEKELPISVNNSDDFKKLTIRKNDDICKTYVEEDGIIYISGTKDCIDFNYVWYSGKLWRITAIYPDGSMKMITEGLMTTISYGSDYNFYTNEINTSYMYQWLNQEFLPTLYNNENIIVENAVWNASPGNGTISTKLPVSGQEEVLVNASVGLLNSYEYYKSYQNTNYSTGYLNIGCYWWLLNRYSTGSSSVWNVYGSGSGSSNSPSSAAYSVRPSVNLKSTIQLTSGSGTVNDPYRIKGDSENIEENVTLINTRRSGEYVKLVDEETALTFRIVGIENINGERRTKLVLNDYVRDTNEVLMKGFGPTTSWSDASENDSVLWRGYLNNTWVKEVDPTYNSETGMFRMIEKGTYYLGSVTYSDNYKLAVCKIVDNGKSIQNCIDGNTEENTTVQENVTGYSGLLRYGEMFASQFGKDYSSSLTMWLITPYDSSDVWRIFGDGSGSRNYPYYMHAARPTINLTSSVVIKSGSGTQQDPFIVGLPS